MQILIIALSGVGDALLCTPALRWLKTVRPELAVDVLVMFKSAQHLLETHPLVREVLYRDFLNGGLADRLRFVAELRRRRYDASLLVYPANRLEYNAIQFLIGAPVRLGHRYLHCNASSLTWLNTRTVLEDNALHNVEENLRLARCLAPDAAPAPPGPLELHLTAADDEFVDRWLAERQLQAAPLLIGFHPGTARFKNHVRRRWPPERFAELGLRLQARRDARILIFGGPDEEPLKAEVQTGMQGHGFVVSGTTMRQTAGLIRRCRLMVSNDSSLMHTAAAAQTPCVAIFGPTNPVFVKPFHAPHRIVSLHLPCSPCFYYSKRPLTCFARLDYLCIRGITVDRVQQEVEQLLAAPDRPAAAPAAPARPADGVGCAPGGGPNG